MGRSFGLIGLVVVLGIGGYIYSSQMTGGGEGEVAPTTNVDLTGVRMDLMSLANAERTYFATNGKYGTLDELRASGDTTITRDRPNFTYSTEVSGNAFKVIAIYSGADPNAPKRVTIDQTMAINLE
jgi:hypothetical protein